MLKLKQEQFYCYLPLYIIEKLNTEDVPTVMYSYIIHNEALHKFITSEMIQAWNDSVDWEKERYFIIEHINWHVPYQSAFTKDIEDYVSFIVKSFNWETDDCVYVEFFDEENENEFLEYVCKNIKHKSRNSFDKDYIINSYDKGYEIIKELNYV